MNFTIDFIKEENARLNAEFEKKYKKPKDRYEHHHERWKIGETIRGLYVMEKWQREGHNGNPTALLRFYAIAEDVFHQFISTYLSHLKIQADGVDKPEKRKNKYGAFDKWAEEHRGEEYTTEQLVEVAGFSYQTTLKYVSESPLFIKVKKGLWRVSAPQDESE